MKPITQSEFDVATLFLSEKADHEIEIKENDVEGIVYICICNEDDWIGLDFKAHINKVHTVGELWKDEWGVHCVDVPVIEIENVTNITVSYNDSNVGNNERLNVDYTTRIDEIKTLISNFIYDEELTTPFKHNAYNTYNV